MNPIALHREMADRGVNIEFTMTAKSNTGTFFAFKFERARYIEIIQEALTVLKATKYVFVLDDISGDLICDCAFAPSEG